MTTLSMYMYVYSDKNKGSNRRNGCSERERERDQSKVVQLFKLTVSGLGGHGSRPTLGIFLQPDLHSGS